MLLFIIRPAKKNLLPSHRGCARCRWQQWARSGTYIPIRELVPQKWQRPGFTRRQRLSHMQFLKVCRENEVTSVDEAWALACAMEDKGDPDLMVPA